MVNGKSLLFDVDEARKLAEHVLCELQSDDDDDTFLWQMNITVCALTSIAFSLHALAGVAVAEKLEADND